ncbi:MULTISPECIES: DUF6236 family protein [Klebsiella/Raoultella group]|nr:MULTISPECIES: DUF6236 family protein [Klebsiella/Raoultella group]HED3762467.1 hypothetical protein [Klebsiella variicola subsp. variicola]MBA8001749.1 hypothetical protein [Klebsiella pneumoniae]MBA8002315.1 hypothetical protein [Klebsiella pneumoniae]MBZ7757698.1 hypothetical protein [Raoultella ornithinolytica]VFZ74696.1 Uncharacterised protein [Klebsiella quasipneumoniae]
MRQEPRGVIVPSMDFESKMIKSSPLLSAHSLRYFLLYWDKVVSVNNPIFGIGNSDSNSDFSVLKKINFIEERGEHFPEYMQRMGGNLQIREDNRVDVLSETFAYTAEKIISANPGVFATHQFGDEGYFSKVSTSIQNANSLEFELYSCFPCPPASVPLGDIWCFRQRRGDELMALRESIDDIYFSMLKSGDILREKSVTLRGLRNAVSDLNRVYDESWKSKLLLNRKITFDFPSVNINSLLKSVAVGSLSFPVTGSPLVSLCLAGGHFLLNSSIKISKPNSKIIRTISGKQVDLSYISSYDGNFVRRA